MSLRSSVVLLSLVAAMACAQNAMACTHWSRLAQIPPWSKYFSAALRRRNTASSASACRVCPVCAQAWLKR